jgi:hypothetical protein
LLDYPDANQYNRVVGKTKFFISFLLSFLGLCAFYYLDQQRNQIISTTCTRTAGDFILTFKRSNLNNKKLEILNLRPGLISIVTKPKVKEVLLLTEDKTVVPAEKKSAVLFQKSLPENLIVSSIRFILKSPSINKIDVYIFRKPLISLRLVLFQFIFLFTLCCIALLTLHILFHYIFRRQGLQNLPINQLIFFLILLIAIFFAFVIFNFRSFLNHYGFYSFSPMFLIKSILFNLLLSSLLTVLFYVFSGKTKGQKLPMVIAALAGLPILLIKIPFDVKTSADSLLWVINLLHRDPNISFAESFSLMLNKFLFGFFNLFTQVNERTTLITTGRLMGVFFIFSIFILINTFQQFSFKKKLLLFLLLSTFSFNILLLGFPEFRYYSLPFLVLSLAAAHKYLSDQNDNNRFLFIAALLAIVAGLFHGTAYFSFPAILMLPLLKNRDITNAVKRLKYIRPYSFIFLAVLIDLFLLLFLVKISGFTLRFNTALGGFDGRQFIAFLPDNVHFPNAVVFLERSYFISRGWAFLITGSFIFLFFLPQWRKRISLEKSDIVFFLFGISQLLIVLFWGYDLGIFEFDLYIAPTTLMYLFLIKCLLSSLPSEKNAWRYIVGFSLFSMLYPLVTVMLLGNNW